VRPVFERLKTALGDAVAASWFNDATLRPFVDGVATVELPTKLKCSHVRTHYDDRVLGAIEAEHPGVRKVQFVVAPAAAPSSG